MRAILAAALIAGSAVAEPFSWDGTYEGHFVCDHVIDGVAGGFSRPFTVMMRQSGDRIDLASQAAVNPSGDDPLSLYRGRLVGTAQAEAGRVMSGYLEVCDPRFPYRELVRLFPATPRAESFTFSAATIFVSDQLPGAEGRLLVESCNWALTRVSSEIPDFEPCAE